MLKVNVYFTTSKKQLINSHILESNEEGLKSLDITQNILVIGAETKSVDRLVHDVTEAMKIFGKYVSENMIHILSKPEYSKTYIIDYTNP